MEEHGEPYVTIMNSQILVLHRATRVLPNDNVGFHLDRTSVKGHIQPTYFKLTELGCKMRDSWWRWATRGQHNTYGNHKQ